MTVALLCPGQGAQKVGMGVPWVEASAAARDVFTRSAEALGFDLLALCAEGPAEKLTRTDICQPAILATSAASLAAAAEDGRIDPDAFGVALGLSLGEYTALWAAGVLELEDALRLVRLRGEAMQAASDAVPSSMTMLGTDRETAESVCAAATSDGGVCVVANLNAPSQVVISGDLAALDRAEAVAAEQGLRKRFRLPVAGAFHSPIMEPARSRLEQAIDAAPFREARFPVISNVDAEPSRDPSVLRRNLVSQLTSPVLFEASIRRAITDGAERFIEASPGRVLTGLVKKVDRGRTMETLDG